jgi:putative flippase GtrA
MTDQLERVWVWLHTAEGTKIFRYSMVSVISTAVSFVVLALVYGFRVWTEVPSTIFANSVATFPSYWLNRRWAWGKGGRSRLTREVLPFWAMSAAGIAFSIIGASLARNVGQAHHLGHIEETALVLLANILSFAIFWTLKLMLFNRLFRVPGLLEEIEEHVSGDADEHPEGVGVR